MTSWGFCGPKKWLASGNSTGEVFPFEFVFAFVFSPDVGRPGSRSAKREHRRQIFPGQWASHRHLFPAGLRGLGHGFGHGLGHGLGLVLQRRRPRYPRQPHQFSIPCVTINGQPWISLAHVQIVYTIDIPWPTPSPRQLPRFFRRFFFWKFSCLALIFFVVEKARKWNEPKNRDRNRKKKYSGYRSGKGGGKYVRDVRDGHDVWWVCYIAIHGHMYGALYRGRFLQWRNDRWSGCGVMIAINVLRLCQRETVWRRGGVHRTTGIAGAAAVAVFRLQQVERRGGGFEKDRSAAWGDALL